MVGEEGLGPESEQQGEAASAEQIYEAEVGRVTDKERDLATRHLEEIREEKPNEKIEDLAVESARVASIAGNSEITVAFLERTSLDPNDKMKILGQCYSNKATHMKNFASREEVTGEQQQALLELARIIKEQGKVLENR
ncbi:MAG: hypothetical protein NT039_00880 [Candidatus Berkelbacteria bacterium]|nr:hypothetical protein [Candidatus Berkelbacteria bacterium]